MPENNFEEQNNSEEKKSRTKMDYFAFLGLLTGSILGVLGFWLFGSVFFILFPFIGGVLGLVAGLVVDKKEEIESKKQIFRNR